MIQVLKLVLVRDRKWLDDLRDHADIFTGTRGDPNNPVEAMHLGTAGKGLKSSDDEALPVLHSLHVEAHQKGEVSMIRRHAPDWLLREMARCYARQYYIDHRKPITGAKDHD